METKGNHSKNPSTLPKKHLPKLHLTHKSLKTIGSSEKEVLKKLLTGFFRLHARTEHKNKNTKNKKVGCWLGDFEKTKKMHQNQNINKHTPVLLHEVVTYLDPQPGETYLDATAGYGGHAREVLERTHTAPTVLVDRDEMAIIALKQQFTGTHIQIMHTDYLHASQQLSNEGRQFDLILADIGVSSPHLEIANRGFAINKDGPLDMRMDQRSSLTAAVIVNSYDEAAIVDVLRRYGEEPHAKRIAKAIVENRPLHSTQALADVIAKTMRGRGKIHPATRTFQALRIAVNDELSQLEQSLPLWLSLLKPGGRIAVISFHSLEDRIVKRVLALVSGNRYDSTLKLLTKRPVTASPQELVTNPRARSAKLRAAVKIKT